jgi:hypothetical protein
MKIELLTIDYELYQDRLTNEYYKGYQSALNDFTKYLKSKGLDVKELKASFIECEG